MRAATLTIEEWQIQFHETMATLLRAQEAVKKQFGIFGLVNGLWKCNRDLKMLNASLKAISELPDGMIEDKLLASQAPQLRKLLTTIEGLLEKGQRNGWTNRTFTSSAFSSITKRGEYIGDYLDALELSLDPEVLKAMNEGREQIARGDYEIMESLF